jgi:hypothetical protein
MNKNSIAKSKFNDDVFSVLDIEKKEDIRRILNSMHDTVEAQKMWIKELAKLIK